MCTPAARQILVTVSPPNPPETARLENTNAPYDRVQVFPVLALIAFQGHPYAHFNDSEHGTPDVVPTHEGMRQAGWKFDRCAAPWVNLVEFDVVINSPQYGICTGWYETEDRAWRVVDAPWPPSQDEEHLTPIIDELRQEALALQKLV
jgi:hypothetical protein